jgi:hypothetical protein
MYAFLEFQLLSSLRFHVIEQPENETEKDDEQRHVPLMLLEHATLFRAKQGRDSEVVSRLVTYGRHTENRPLRVDAVSTMTTSG